ncbi:MAG: DeoR/GlpR transcriptional regulator [Lachnospiraceae bacterium]|nr:DeoR/GlpR transcriptional regulator [Lachnospiraceae bacterium]
MTQTERQEAIYSIILEKESCNVKELCTLIYASPATIRRDLHTLERKGLINLQYGNITLTNAPDRHLPLALRSIQEKDAKRLIARYAAGLIPSNATVILDSSSSALYMADYIRSGRGITVFTNCITTAMKLSENKVDVFLMGGQLDESQVVTSGPWTLQNVMSINADYMFFSSRYIDDQGNITARTHLGAQIRQYMIEHAKKQYFLCTSEKLSKTSTFHLCRAQSLTGVITDTDLSFLPDVRFINVHDSRI